MTPEQEFWFEHHGEKFNVDGILRGLQYEHDATSGISERTHIALVMRLISAQREQLRAALADVDQDTTWQDHADYWQKKCHALESKLAVQAPVIEAARGWVYADHSVYTERCADPAVMTDWDDTLRESIRAYDAAMNTEEGKR